MKDSANLDAVEGAVAAAAAKAADLESLGKAADALKAVADARQANDAATQARRAFSLSRMQSLAALLVPIVSIGALVATVFLQMRQVAATATAATQQIEDTEWRDLLNSLKVGPSAVYSDVTIVPRLQSFAHSDTYGTQVKQMAIILLGRLATPEGFDQLFTATFPTITSDNVSDVIRVSKNLATSELNLESRCPSGYDCDSGLGLSNADKQQGTNAQLARQLYIELGNVYTEQRHVSQRLVSYVRVHQPVDLDLSQASIAEADLTGIEFVGSDISGTIFDKDDMTNATLATTHFSDAEFRRVNWWDASEISPDLLRYLIARYNPNYFPNNAANAPISDGQYMVKLKRLCSRAAIDCPRAPFGRMPWTR
jgi:hypothetical protein